MPSIDLRSDTVTQPTAGMREAMASAEVGDDVYEEDPTVRRLEETAAQMLGKEGALLVPSGTMGNLVSVLCHCGRGDEILLGDRSHIFLNEVGGISALGGVHPRIIGNEDDGTLPLDALEHAVREEEIHYPSTRLICLENTHNYCMGSPLPPDYMEQVAGVAARHGLKIHLDGARVFNAAAALEVEVSHLVRHVDSVMFCLSKGLSAPVGSMICGTGDFIRRARKLRKMVGGGMRQAGHLAAAGLVALTDLVERLRDDHRRAQTLARGLASLQAIELRPDQVKTNIVIFKVDPQSIQPETFLTELESRNIKILMIGTATFRAVLHREISDDQVETVLQTVQNLLP